MAFVLLIASMFVLSVLAIVVATMQPHTHRRAMFVVGILSPLIVPLSIVAAIFNRDGKVSPCPPRLEEVEKNIDDKRVETFGGKPRIFYISQSWKVRYHRYLNNSAQSIQDLVENRRAA
jgi:hypothetical protein